jgi:hypothetical protein
LASGGILEACPEDRLEVFLEALEVFLEALEVFLEALEVFLEAPS